MGTWSPRGGQEGIHVGGPWGGFCPYWRGQWNCRKSRLLWLEILWVGLHCPIHTRICQQWGEVSNAMADTFHSLRPLPLPLTYAFRHFLSDFLGFLLLFLSLCPALNTSSFPPFSLHISLSSPRPHFTFYHVMTGFWTLLWAFFWPSRIWK